MRHWLARRSSDRQKAKRLYDGIVAQSRLPALYQDLGIPDTETGRFESIVLHLFVVLERLKTCEGPEGKRLAQALSETFVDDVDTAMREIGVADIAVGKKMHAAAGAFLGRLLAYREAVAARPTIGGTVEPANDPLAGAIARNVLTERAAMPGPVRASVMAPAERLAAHVRGLIRHLDTIPDPDLLAGHLPTIDLVKSSDGEHRHGATRG